MRFSLMATALFLFAAGCSIEAPSDALSSTDYRNLGIPPADRVWSPDDYQQAASALRSLDAAALPRSSETAGALILDRITDRNSVQSCRHAEGLAPDRLALCAKTLKSLSEIVGVYSGAIEVDQTLAAECVRVMQATLLSSAETNDLYSEIEEGLDGGYPPDIRTRFQAGIVGTLEGAIETLAPRSNFPETSRADLAQTITEVFPRLRAQLPAIEQERVLAALRDMREHDANNDVRAALSGLN
jgi:hypothetical protein